MFIDTRLLRDIIDGLDWYHINKRGELVHGANGKDDEPLYKASDIFNVIDNLDKDAE